MFCSSCGNQIADDSRFCAHCGHAVGMTPPPPVSPVPPPPSSVEPVASDAVGSSHGTDLDGEATLLDSDAGGTPATGAEALLEPGTVFHERYAIREVLGQGGMGIVYRAEDQVTGDDICLKVIRSELLGSDALAQRFLREARLTRDLRDAGIVAVYDVGVAGGSYYMTMEYIEGQTLRQWLATNLREHREVPLRVACGLTWEILRALGVAHRAGVVHRDLKPENILLLGEPLESEFKLKILDFGIARAVAPGANLTVEGAALGTPIYMAPEQETVAAAVGPEADLYSIGVIFYEILVGVPPRGRWELPCQLRQDLPPAVDPLCERALHAHPARRLQGVDEFQSALLEASQAEPAPRRRAPRSPPPRPARPGPPGGPAAGPRPPPPRAPGGPTRLPGRSRRHGSSRRHARRRRRASPRPPARSRRPRGAVRGSPTASGPRRCSGPAASAGGSRAAASRSSRRWRGSCSGWDRCGRST